MPLQTPLPKPRLPLWPKLCIVIGLVLVLATSGLIAAAYTLTQRYENNVERADLLGSSKHDGRQLDKVDGPLNILLIGSDSREQEEYDPQDGSSTQASVPGQRSDAIMVLHIPEGADRGYVISIPRDTYVEIPAETRKDDLADGDDDTWSGGEWKINAAYAWGGAPLVVRTVEKLTGLTMDHVVVVDFAALRTITDLVGGVDVNVEQEVTDPRTQRTFTEGINHLDGQAAEDYVRQRYALPAGDFDRIKRQQQYLRALMTKVQDKNWITSPKKFDDLMMTLTGALTVDSEMPVRELALTLKDVPFDQIAYVTLPIGGSDTLSGPGWVAYPDEMATKQLFFAIESDNMEEYLLANPSNDINNVA